MQTNDSQDKNTIQASYTATLKKGAFSFVWDDSCFYLTGQHASAMESSGVLQTLFGDFFPRWTAALEYALKAGASCVLEHTLLTCDGPFTVRHTLTPQTRSVVTGSICRTLSAPMPDTVLDLADLFASLPIPAFYIDADLRIQWANKAGVHEITLLNKNCEPWQGNHCYSLLFAKKRPCKECPVTSHNVEGAGILNAFFRPDGQACTKTLTKKYDQAGNHIGTLVTWAHTPGLNACHGESCHPHPAAGSASAEHDKTLYALYAMLIQQQGNGSHMLRTVLKTAAITLKASRMTAYTMIAGQPALLAEYSAPEECPTVRPPAANLFRHLARSPLNAQRVLAIPDTQAPHMPTYAARDFLRRAAMAALYCPAPTDGGIAILLVEQSIPRAWSVEEQRMAEAIAQRVSLLAGFARHGKTRTSLEGLINALPGVFFRLRYAHDDVRLEYIGGACRELTGYDADEIMEKTMVEISQRIHPEDREAFVAANAPRDGAAGPHDLTFRLYDKNGATRHIQQRAWAATDISARESLVIEGLLTDVSEGHLLREAQQANEDKRAFLATMSHEIRTPMNVVIGMARMALKSGLSEEQRKYVNNIHAAATSLVTIINDILDYTKGEAGKVSLACAPFHPEEIVRQLKALFTPVALEKGVKFTVTAGEAVPKIATGDPARISQVLINLVSNALKFTEQGSVDVTIDVAEQRAENILLRFYVKDTGIGIAPERQKNIFKAFQPADVVGGARRFGGAGLGLAISKMLAGFMDGDIVVESVPGLGTTMTFTCRVTSALPIPASAEEDERMPRFHGGSILLVEDNKINQEIALTLLTDAGFTVVVAQNGREALEVLHSHTDDCPFSLILMDLQMPELDGHQTTTFIRGNKNWNHIPIIAMTAHAISEERQRCLDIGMQGYIMKPIDSKTFYHTLETFLLAT